ncbi:MAG TPA: CocE/NonD family hydrolase, partial [Gemmataceae bacterium]|nr:CocE/NonD family hydrolase [Gemmataceae bacterium]
MQRIALSLGILLVCLAQAFGQVPGADPAGRYAKTDVMIAMRDGVRLNTAIYAPKDMKEPLPIIFMRTPYGIANAAGNFRAYLKEMAEEGYVFAFQDIRRRFSSEGQFVMSRPPRDKSDTKAVDESTDTFDSIEWMIKNVPDNNGRVGML